MKFTTQLTKTIIKGLKLALLLCKNTTTKIYSFLWKLFVSQQSFTFENERWILNC